MPRHPFETQLAQSWPPDQWRDITVVVAVSGGPDSIALLRGLQAVHSGGAMHSDGAGYSEGVGHSEGVGRLIAAHFNHRLRGAESDADEHFTVECCRSLDIECDVGQAPQGSGHDQPKRDEESSRNARYRFLIDVARARGARFVVTAHTADDQAETILLRILRGTGLSGLAGIPRARELTRGVSLLRPLLPVRRADVLRYLTDLCQPCRRDSSNFDLRYARNRIRADLLPRICAEYNTQAAEALVRLGQLADETQNVLHGRIEQTLAASVVEKSSRTVTFDCRPLSNQPPLIVRECLIQTWRDQGWGLQAMGYTEWCDLASLMQATGREPVSRVSRHFPGAIVAECQGSRVVLVQEAVGA